MIKCKAEISDKETTFPDTYIYKGARRNPHLMIAPDVRTHFKLTETFQYYTHFSSCHQQGVKKGFIKKRPYKDFSEQILLN